jgi:hypothetical protein
MSQKKSRLDQKLDGGMQSWEAQVTQSVRAAPQEPEVEEDTDKIKRKTFLVTQALIDRVNRIAQEHHVGQNELIRYLLTWSLDQIESGNHTIPLGTPRYTIEC